MGSADWTELTGSLSAGSLIRGPTNGIARPNGGGNFIYGYNSQDVTAGTHGLFCNLANFAPTAANKGGSIRGAIQRGVSSGVLNFTPLLFIGLQSALTTANGYMLGLQDDDPHKIVLRKGQLSQGIPAGLVGTNGILARSTATYAPGTWLHLRLDMIVNLTGDVLLQAFANNLVANAVSAPVWAAIPGLDNIVDDVLGVNTGSVPYTSGRMGFGFTTQDVNRRGYFDHIEVIRQN